MKNYSRLSQLFAEKFDSFDQSNDSATRFFIPDSLEGKLALALERKIKDNDTFVVVWLKLLQLLLSPSMDLWDIFKDKIKNATPMNYEGQIIRDLCNDFLRIWVRCCNVQVTMMTT